MPRVKIRFAVVLPLLLLAMSLGSLTDATLHLHRVTLEQVDPETHQPRKIRKLTADPSLTDSRYRDGKVTFFTPETIDWHPPRFPTAMQAVSILSLPGMLGEIALSLPANWPESWYPDVFDLWQWRGISWPLYALIFGWAAGRALDALRKKGARIRIWEALPLLALSIFLFVFLAVGIATDSYLNDEDGLARWMLGGVFLWACLSLLPSLAWILQFGQRRRAVAEVAKQPEAVV
jgi:hypothetical protein